MVQVGQPVPDFEMEGVFKDEFKKFKLSDYRGKWVIFFYWPLDFTFVCPTEVTAFSKRVADFEALNTVILGASVDSKFTHLAWQKEIGKISYPMLSDITKETARNYGVLIEKEGIALRGLYIIDPDGILKYQVVHDLNVGRNVDEVLRVVKALQTGELCPADWEEGMETLGSA
ncbi:MAG: peroxiredoxin [Armatimonadota bacterium]